MRSLLGAFVLAVFAASCGGADSGLLASDEAVTASHAIVLAELFTSEGCSSCPPADEILSQLVERQPIANVDIVGLGEHVDYWDRLGWRDAFSSATFTDRQSQYETRVFHTGSVYTPQLVIDGRFQEIGSDGTAVRRAIGNAAQLPKVAVTVMAQFGAANEARVQVLVDVPQEFPGREMADVIVAVAEARLVTDVLRGENRRRRLKHSAVARTLRAVGSLDAQTSTFSTVVTIPLGATWKRSDLTAITFVQERQRRRVIGVGSASLTERTNTQ